MGKRKAKKEVRHAEGLNPHAIVIPWQPVQDLEVHQRYNACNHNVPTTNAPPNHELSTDDNIINISTIESTNESNSNNDTTQELNDTINIAPTNENVANQNDPIIVNETQPNENNSELLTFLWNIAIYFLALERKLTILKSIWSHCSINNIDWLDLELQDFIRNCPPYVTLIALSLLGSSYFVSDIVSYFTCNLPLR